MRVKVIGHSITTGETTGQDPHGGDAIGRHWLRDSLVDLEPAEAEAFFLAGAVAPAPSESPAPPPKQPLSVEQPASPRDELTPVDHPRRRK